jgi:hypothetical protein
MIVYQLSPFFICALSGLGEGGCIAHGVSLLGFNSFTSPYPDVTNCFEFDELFFFLIRTGFFFLFKQTRKAGLQCRLEPETL